MKDRSVSITSNKVANQSGIRRQLLVALLIGSCSSALFANATNSVAVEPQTIVQKPAHIAPQNIDKALRVESASDENPKKAVARERTRKSAINAKYQKNLVDYIYLGYRTSEVQMSRIVREAVSAGRRHKVDPLLILAVIAVESSFKNKAQSGAGAQGLMQIHTRVHMDKFKQHGGAYKVFDPAANIDVGTQILKDYIDKSGSVPVALKWYVGARYSKSDGGYAKRVLLERDRLEVASRGEVTLALKMLRDRGVRTRETQTTKTSAKVNETASAE